MLSTMIARTLAGMLTKKLITAIIVSLMEIAVEFTDNKWDDKLLEKVKKASKA